ncbi:MAG: hypothetical protein ACJ72O_15685, partial [Marmoricola sp.]
MADVPVSWITAFIDLPALSWELGIAFWCGVTATELSPVRGADGEFATLLTSNGEAFLRVQRTGAE